METPRDPLPDTGESGEAYDAEILTIAESEGHGDLKSPQCPTCGQLWATLELPRKRGGMTEPVRSHICPRCGKAQLNVYYSNSAGERLGVLCEVCNMKAYYLRNELVPINF